MLPLLLLSLLPFGSVGLGALGFLAGSGELGFLGNLGAPGTLASPGTLGSGLLGVPGELPVGASDRSDPATARLARARDPVLDVPMTGSTSWITVDMAQ